jgi:hypothetical protein
MQNVRQCQGNVIAFHLLKIMGRGSMGNLVLSLMNVCAFPGRQVNKVAGNFHFAPGRSFQQGNMHVHDIAPFGDAVMDFSHTIHKLSFGKAYPGMKNPLDGTKVNRHDQGATGMYQYFVKVGSPKQADTKDKLL